MKQMIADSRVAIVVVSWNAAERTLDCLASLKRLEYTNRFVIVVDNDSEDHSEARIRQSHPEHVVIQSGTNRGFAAGANIGIRYALHNGADYVLLLNNDTRADPKLIGELVRACASGERIGLSGGCIETMSDPPRVWGYAGRFNVDTGAAHHFLSPAEFDAYVFEEPWYLYIPACCVLIKRKCLEEVGLFPEEYFHLAEDVDFCIKAQRAGWKAVMEPKARLLHEGSASMRRFSPLYNYYEQRNRLLVIRKYRLNQQSLWRRMHNSLMIVARLLSVLVWVDRPRHFLRGARFVGLAVLDFFRERKGKREEHPGYHTVPSLSERRSCRREGDL